MTPVHRAVAFWVFRVGLAVLLAVGVQAWRGPDPFLWWLAGGYALISAFTTYVIIRRHLK